MRPMMALQSAAVVLGVTLSTLAQGVPAAAAPVAPMVAQAQKATLGGTVRDAIGSPLAGARVVVSGPFAATTITDGNGSFVLNVPPGSYTVTVERSGFSSVTLTDLIVTAGSTAPVAVTMTQLNLSSLRTIGSVTSTARGGSINVGPAVSTFTPGRAFSDLGSPQINNELEHIPGVVVQHMGSQPDTSIILGGVQPYETQVLIDGHPLALGQYGVWTSQYYPSWLVGGVETQSGPGNTTPFANIAVGGTVNLLSPAFTAKPTTNLVYGTDNYYTQTTSLVTSGALGRLGYVVGVGSGGQNTPLSGTTECIVSKATATTGTIKDCGSANGNLFQKGDIFKLRYDFSPNTSLEVGGIGAFSGYNPQGTAWGTYLGAVTIVPCQTNGVVCSNPNYSQFIGQTITGYGWYEGSSITNNQWLWDAQFRTSFGNTTLLVRPYLGDIQPEVNNGVGQRYLPKFYGPVGAALFPNGTVPPANYVYPVGSAEATCASSGKILSAAGTYTVVNGQFECFTSPFSTYEQDKQYGMTTSVIQPIGSGQLNFTYDFHGQSTIALNNNAVAVPFSTDRYSTFSLTGDVPLASKINMDFGLYNTTWSVNGFQLATPSDPTSTVLTSLSRSITHFDPHLAFVVRPVPNVAIRAAAGTSTTFPFVGQVSGLATYQRPACSLGPPFADGGTLTKKNPNLNPETSIAYNLGADMRMRNGAVMSIDALDTIVHGVFETITTETAVNLPLTCGTPAAIEGIFTPINAAKLDAKLLILKYALTPRKGFGYNISATAESSIVTGLTPTLFTPGGASFPVNGVQICGNGVAAPGIPTCIPYLQGYGQFTFAQPDGTFMAIGVNYQGKNNSYFQPPFALVDFVARRPVSRNLEFQLSVENLLNTNNYGAYLAIPGAGTPLTASTTNTAFSSVNQTSFTPTEISAPARIVRVSLRLHQR